MTAFIHADWNRNFDEKSALLMQELPALQHPDYIQEYAFFQNVREALLNNQKCVRAVQRAAPEKKLRIQDRNLSIIIKKRRGNHIHDMYPWELSYLLGAHSTILPSFPMELGGKIIILQRLEPFATGKWGGGGYPKGFLRRVSLENYWKAHLLIYLLGISDLPETNVGVNSEGVIRLFDNEASLIYYNTPSKSVRFFFSGFICQSFDWPQYAMPLDEKTANCLIDFVEGFSDFEENLKIYLKYRPVSVAHDALQHRLNIVRSFPFREGATFRDFFGSVFPKMSPGLDELSCIMSQILKRKVHHGSALFFASKTVKSADLSLEDRTKLQQWVNTYID